MCVFDQMGSICVNLGFRVFIRQQECLSHFAAGNGPPFWMPTNQLLACDNWFAHIFCACVQCTLGVMSPMSLEGSHVVCCHVVCKLLSSIFGHSTLFVHK